MNSLKKIDYLFIVILLFLAVFIWLRETSWMSTSDDTLPILIAIPAFIWLGSPWSFRENSLPISTTKILIATFLLAMGIAFNVTLLLAIGWTLLLWAWLSSRIIPGMHDSITKLLVLPIMAFPWIVLDADRIGWWFRLSGAWVTAHFFSLAGFNVVLDGTEILINKLPVSVEAACAGLNTLQSILIAGSVAAYLLLGNTNRFWYNIPFLFIMAWISNVVRILVICIAALAVSPEFAMGSFHTWGGWVVLLFMFSLCWLFFSLQAPNPQPPSSQPTDE